jgi:hypothetical protein
MGSFRGSKPRTCTFPEHLLPLFNHVLNSKSLFFVYELVDDSINDIWVPVVFNSFGPSEGFSEGHLSNSQHAAPANI